MIAFAGVFIGLMVLVVTSAIVWSRRATSPKPARRWAVVIALVWASLQLLGYLRVMYPKKFAS
jgi:phosphoglycerol transferase MdoB-like AlkP superfamily enzyme